MLKPEIVNCLPVDLIQIHQRLISQFTVQAEMEVSNLKSLIPFCPACLPIMPNLQGKMGHLEL